MVPEVHVIFFSKINSFGKAKTVLFIATLFLQLTAVVKLSTITQQPIPPTLVTIPEVAAGMGFTDAENQGRQPELIKASYWL